MKHRNVVTALMLLTGLALLSSLTACDTLGEALGMSRSDPAGDGKITTEQPLALPPDYTLKPPRETARDADPASTEHPASPDPDLEKHH